MDYGLDVSAALGLHCRQLVRIPPTMLLRDQIECKLLTVLSVSKSISATIGPEPSVFIGNWGFLCLAARITLYSPPTSMACCMANMSGPRYGGMVDIYAQLSTIDWPK